MLISNECSAVLPQFSYFNVTMTVLIDEIRSSIKTTRTSVFLIASIVILTFVVNARVYSRNELNCHPRIMMFKTQLSIFRRIIVVYIHTCLPTNAYYTVVTVIRNDITFIHYVINKD